MSTTQALVTTLDTITGTGKFTSQGDSSFFLPNIKVHGEELAFPLPPSQVKHLIALAEQAPYGKGEDTIHDDHVRQSWQIDAQHIDFPTEGKWQKYLQKISAQVAKDMGIRQDFILDPYKLLIYEQGGHFRPHTDTEKIPRMFATLVIALPSKHRGGELLIRHAGEEVSTSFEPSSNAFQHIAFFADCEHEVKPVTSGYRVCLTYNLAFKKSPKSELNLSHTAYTGALGETLTKLHAEMKDEAHPLRAILLNHQYTEENFSRAALKNEDFTKAKALMVAAQACGFHAHLGLVTLYQMGELDSDDDDYGYGYSRRSRSKNNADTMGEIYEDSLTIDSWRSIDDRPTELGTYHIKPTVFIPETKLEDGKPDEEESEGYTGNAGCTMEYWYRKAAVILWPKQSLNSILCHYNLHGAAQTFLNHQSQKLSKSAAEALGLEILKQLAAKEQNDSYYNLPITETMAGISKLKSISMLSQSLKTFSPDTLSNVNEDTWEKLFNTFEHSHFLTYFKSIPKDTLANNSQTILPPLHAILTCSRDSPLPAILANQLNDHHFTQKHCYLRDEKTTTIDAGLLHLMLAASAHVDQKSIKNKLRSHVEHDMSLDHIREKLCDAMLDKKHILHFSHTDSLFQPNLTKTIKILEQEVARPINSYPDYTRPYIKKQSSHHQEDSFFNQLETFCLCSDSATFDIRARASIRDSITNHIRESQLDFDCQTIKKGTPHTLRLSKNDHSYHRALKTRESDILQLKRLRVYLK